MNFSASQYSWQAGYPQSGNTWLVFLISHLEGQDVNEWGTPIPNWNDVATGKEEAALGWVRAHQEFSFPVMQTIQTAVYIFRHPFDVALSSWRYRKNFHDEPLDLPAYIDRFIYHRGEPSNERAGFGSWCSNVRSWMLYADRMVPSLAVIKYEDLREDPVGVLERAVRRPRAEVERAVRLSDIERMRKLDNQNFVGQGSTGRWREVMTDDQIKRGRLAFGSIMEQVGYNVGG